MLSFFLLVGVQTVKSESIFIPQISEIPLDALIQEDFSEGELVKHRKLKAVLLAVFLGHFGVHRIYLGTSPNVPVVYALTLGGGFGLLPLIDAIALIRSKDLDEFAESDQVFMWLKPRNAIQP